jgi:antitoxin CptB
LDALETWLDVPDQQIFAWVNGSEPTPAEINTPMFRRLRAFHRAGEARK